MVEGAGIDVVKRKKETSDDILPPLSLVGRWRVVQISIKLSEHHPKTSLNSVPKTKTPLVAMPLERHELDFDKWIDDNQFSPMRPPSDFSPSSWLPSGERSEAHTDEPQLNGLGIDIDLFPSHPLPIDDIYLAGSVTAMTEQGVNKSHTRSDLTRQV